MISASQGNRNNSLPPLPDRNPSQVAIAFTDSEWDMDKICAYIQSGVEEGLLDGEQSSRAIAAIDRLRRDIGPSAKEPDVATEGDGEVALYWYHDGRIAEFRTNPDAYSSIVNRAGDSIFIESATLQDVVAWLAGNGMDILEKSEWPAR